MFDDDYLHRWFTHCSLTSAVKETSYSLSLAQTPSAMITSFRDSVPSNRVVEMEGHDDTVNECSFSNDRRLLVTSSEDTIVRLWDVDSHQCIATLKNHRGSVNSCKFSPDDTLVASASDDNTLRLWDVKSHRCIAILSGHSNAVNSCAFSTDGAVLASASDGMTVRLWNIKTFMYAVTFKDITVL